VRIAEIRFLFGYDRWATRRVLDAASGVDEAVWSAERVVDERGLGGILVHQLGAQLRWRHFLSGSSRTPRPERDPLPTPADLRAAWEQEWEAVDVWLDEIDDAFLTRREDDVPVWQLLAHVVNHGTQHRSEAAVLLTEAGHSPGDLDLMDYSELLAAENEEA
jgi:uncharacterized damage-inducible protein DinB